MRQRHPDQLVRAGDDEGEFFVGVDAPTSPSCFTRSFLLSTKPPPTSGHELISPAATKVSGRPSPPKPASPAKRLRLLSCTPPATRPCPRSIPFISTWPAARRTFPRSCTFSRTAATASAWAPRTPPPPPGLPCS